MITEDGLFGRVLAGGSEFQRMVVTTTGSIHSTEVQYLTQVLSDRMQASTELLSWNVFFPRLLNPTDGTLIGNEVLCLLVIRFDDWNDLNDVAPDAVVPESYAVVRKKTDELIYSLNCVASRSQAKFLIGILPCSTALANISTSVPVLDETMRHLKNSLAHLENVQVVDLAEGGLLLLERAVPGGPSVPNSFIN